MGGVAMPTSVSTSSQAGNAAQPARCAIVLESTHTTDFHCLSVVFRSVGRKTTDKKKKRTTEEPRWPNISRAG